MKGEVDEMSAVSRKAPREEGVDETKTLPLTVRVSQAIYEKLRAEAEERGISVPALITYQMGEWLRGDDLDRKTTARGNKPRGDRRGSRVEDPEEDAMLWNCSGCGEAVTEEEYREAGFQCPDCGEPSGSLSPAEDADDDEGTDAGSGIVTIRKGKEREEPKVPDVLKCDNDGGLLGDPCGWAGKKAEAEITFNPAMQARTYSCPKCHKPLQKTRLFKLKDDVLPCPKCHAAYRRDELVEKGYWGKNWLTCPDEECGGKVIEAAPVKPAKRAPDSRA